METDTVTILDFEPLIPHLIALFVSVATAIVGWLGGHLAGLLKIEKDSKVRAYLQDASIMAIEFAAEQARRKGADFSSVKVRNNMTTLAVSYLLTHVPDALKRFNLGPEDIAEMIEARLPPNLSETYHETENISDTGGINSELSHPSYYKSDGAP